MNKKVLIVGCGNTGRVCLSTKEVLEILAGEHSRKLQEENVMKIENIYKDIDLVNQVYVPEPRRRKNRKSKRVNHYE